jgi:hypothetical protein
MKISQEFVRQGTLSPFLYPVGLRDIWTKAVEALPIGQISLRASLHSIISAAVGSSFGQLSTGCLLVAGCGQRVLASTLFPEAVRTSDRKITCK